MPRTQTIPFPVSSRYILPDQCTGRNKMICLTCIDCSVTAAPSAEFYLSIHKKLSPSGSDYHSHSFIIQIRLQENDSSLLPAHQSADPKAEQHGITDTESAYHTHFSSFSAHIYAAQTPHAARTVKKYLCYKQPRENPPSVQE